MKKKRVKGMNAHIFVIFVLVQSWTEINFTNVSFCRDRDKITKRFHVQSYLKHTQI